MKCPKKSILICIQKIISKSSKRKKNLSIENFEFEIKNNMTLSIKVFNFKEKVRKKNRIFLLKKKKLKTYLIWQKQNYKRAQKAQRNSPVQKKRKNFAKKIH